MYMCVRLCVCMYVSLSIHKHVNTCVPSVASGHEPYAHYRAQHVSPINAHVFAPRDKAARGLASFFFHNFFCISAHGFAPTPPFTRPLAGSHLRSIHTHTQTHTHTHSLTHSLMHARTHARTHAHSDTHSTSEASAARGCQHTTHQTCAGLAGKRG